MDEYEIRETISRMKLFSRITDRTHRLSVLGIGCFHIDSKGPEFINKIWLETNSGKKLDLQNCNLDEHIKELMAS